jgi:hypothetical protein
MLTNDFAMRATPSLLAALLLSACAGCVGWGRPALGPPAAAPQPSRPLGMPRSPPTDGAPIIPDPNAVVPRIELGAWTRTPPRPTWKAANPAKTGQSAAKPPSAVRWDRVFESAQRRPLQTLRVGAGPQRILVMGSLTGNDPDSVFMMDALAERLMTQPDFARNATVLLLRTPNPDGLAERISTNVRGVDLNRNFPSARFTASPNQQTGPHPASEPETRAVLRLLGEFKPTRVVHLRTGRNVRGTLIASARTAGECAAFIDKSRFDFRPADKDLKAGSLEEFASHRMNAEVIVIELPRSSAPVSQDHVAAVARMSLGSRVPDGSSPGSTSPPTPPFARGEDETPGRASRPSPAALVEPDGPDGRHGYVELLPPPPHVDQLDGSTDDPKYHELTPPH